MESLEIEIDVNESYINRVEAGQAVEAVLDHPARDDRTCDPTKRFSSRTWTSTAERRQAAKNMG